MRLKIGLLAETMGDYEEAARCFEDVLRRAPDDPRRHAIGAKLDLLHRKAAAGSRRLAASGASFCAVSRRCAPNGGSYA